MGGFAWNEKLSQYHTLDGYLIKNSGQLCVLRVEKSKSFLDISDGSDYGVLSDRSDRKWSFNRLSDQTGLDNDFKPSDQIGQRFSVRRRASINFGQDRYARQKAIVNSNSCGLKYNTPLFDSCTGRTLPAFQYLSADTLPSLAIVALLPSHEAATACFRWISWNAKS